jgi:hypothetical protein
MGGNGGHEQRQTEQRLGEAHPAQGAAVGGGTGDLAVREPGAGVRGEAPVEVQLPRACSRTGHGQITAERRFDEMKSSVM